MSRLYQILILPILQVLKTILNQLRIITLLQFAVVGILILILFALIF